MRNLVFWPVLAGTWLSLLPTHAWSDDADAYAKIVAPDGRAIGDAQFWQEPEGVRIRVDARMLEPGPHGIHLHSIGTCSPDFKASGGHINVTGAKHGLLHPDGPDNGDLPNIYAGTDGVAQAELFTPRVSVFDNGSGGSDIGTLLDENGSALVVHAEADDHHSQPIGGAGGRVACGAITAGVGTASLARIPGSRIHLYESMPQVLLSLNRLPAFRERQVHRRHDTSLWVRLDHDRQAERPQYSTTDARWNLTRHSFRAGLQVPVGGGGLAAQGLTSSVYYVYELTSANLSGPTVLTGDDPNEGTIETKAHTLGASLTWRGDGGLYLDGHAAGKWYSSDLATTVAGTAASGIKAFGASLAFEVGRDLATESGLQITPYGRVSLNRLALDAFRDRVGAHVSNNGVPRRLAAEAGISAGWEVATAVSLYALASIGRETGEDAAMVVEGRKLHQSVAGMQGRISAGAIWTPTAGTRLHVSIGGSGSSTRHVGDNITSSVGLSATF